MTIKAIIALTSAVILSACSDSPALPDASSRPYEVLLAAPDTTARKIVCQELEKSVEGLPQDEPSFDVSKSDDGKVNDITRQARAIVTVSVDEERYSVTRMRYQKNLYAKPQMVVSITTPSTDVLRKDMDKQGVVLRELLTRAEMNHDIATDRQHNTKAEILVKKKFSHDIKLPDELKATKQGKDFVWVSNAAPSGMQNICLYTYKGSRLLPEQLLLKRDSIMRENIPGEREGTYMTTAKSTVYPQIKAERNGKRLLVRGLWEMEGDMMGGPFVCHAIVDSTHHNILVAEAFVYAPETKKRNIIRHLEAVLYTLQ